MEIPDPLIYGIIIFLLAQAVALAIALVKLYLEMNSIKNKLDLLEPFIRYIKEKGTEQALKVYAGGESR